MKKCFYASLAEAQQATKPLASPHRQNTSSDTLKTRDCPVAPNVTYSANWQSWPTFLGKEEKTFHPSFTEAQLVAQTLGITSVPEYQKRYHEDPRLPRSPGRNVE
ncbi:integrase repeat-containing protein [Shewanella sp. SM32]|uniref:integrase repeat-containing protein n=1 Tax=Shewanella sp. SM32 TaxID=2912796 RepID=UPI0021D96464|nr:integrase repeat-containing protein [Shewanella sp. SM32]MCU8070658.1 hypothetical protein [Shewanella sp. SM32]